MASAVLNALPEKEWLLIKETETAALADLSEDELIDLHARVRRARTKYVTNYRRAGSAKVSGVGGRGKARQQNTRNRDRAEVFEDALARVSRALAAAAKASAAELKAERLAAAAAAKAGGNPAAPAPKGGRSPRASQVADRGTDSPRSRKKNAGTLAAGARRQAKRDSR
jgi:hypothetical protein